MLRVSGAYSRAIRPARGVGPGRAFADVLVTAFCVDALGEPVLRYPSVTLDAHADDVTASAYGGCGEVKRSRVDCATDFNATLELDLEAEVAQGKTAVVASSRMLAVAIANAGEGLVWCDQDATVALVADVAVGKAKRHGARLAARTAKLRTVRGRMRRFCRVTRSAKQHALRLFVAGLRPAATYGAEICARHTLSLPRRER